MRWSDSISDSMDMNLNKLQETVKDRGAWHIAVHRVTKSWTPLNHPITDSISTPRCQGSQPSQLQ